MSRADRILKEYGPPKHIQTIYSDLVHFAKMKKTSYSNGDMFSGKTKDNVPVTVIFRDKDDSFELMVNGKHQMGGNRFNEKELIDLWGRVSQLLRGK